jgi:acyl homoserine lactone synthase
MKCGEKMIYAVSQENAHKFGDVMPSMYRLRHRAFIERQSYDVHSIRNMEYDSYDTPAAIYLVWKQEEGIVSGCTRLSPTDRPYMIKDLWPDLIKNHELPTATHIWEASRFCIDKALSPELRRRIHIDLLCGMQEIGLSVGIEFMIGVMQPAIWRKVFTSVGWPIDFLGNAKNLEGREQIVAGRMPISEDILFSLRDRYSVNGSVIANLDESSLKEVA